MCLVGLRILWGDGMAKTAAARKREQLQRQGVKQINVHLSADERAYFDKLRDAYGGPNSVKEFAARAVMVGAKFLANAGRPKGRKFR